MIFFYTLAFPLSTFNNHVLKPNLVSVVNMHVIYLMLMLTLKYLKKDHGTRSGSRNFMQASLSLKMISSPYCAVSEPNVCKHYKRLTRWNANRCYSLRITYLIFETFQTLFPTASLTFTAVKVFIK